MSQPFESQQLIPIKKLIAYEEKYQVRLPDSLKKILSEIGYGFYSSLKVKLDEFGNLKPPRLCMEQDMILACLKKGTSKGNFDSEHEIFYFEDKLNALETFYSYEENTFSDPLIQEVYEELDSNRDKYLTILFPLNLISHFLDCLIINKNFTTQLWSFDTEYGALKLETSYQDHLIDTLYYRSYEDKRLLPYLLKLANYNWDYWKAEIEKLNGPLQDFQNDWIKPSIGSIAKIHTKDNTSKIILDLKIFFSDIPELNIYSCPDNIIQKLSFEVPNIEQLSGKQFDYSTLPIKSSLSIFVNKCTSFFIRNITFGSIIDQKIKIRIEGSLDLETANTRFKNIKKLVLEVDAFISEKEIC